MPNAQRCLHNGGTPPFGYNVVNQRLVLNADEAPVVQMIFNWYVFQGYGYNCIAKELNERGFRNKAGEPFNGTSIRDMLLNEKYTGTYVYNKRSSYDSMGNKIYLERAIMHFISQMCEGENFQLIMRELQRYAKEQNEGSGELQFLETKYNKVEREIGNLVKAIMSGFDAEELRSAYDALKADKTKLSAQIAIERQKQAQRIDIDEASVRKALSRISADICESKPLGEYKQLFSSFVERVDVFEDYVTIVLKVFDMINVHVCNGSGVIKEEPPLDCIKWWSGMVEPRGID